MDKLNSCSCRDEGAGKLVKEHVEDYCSGTTIHGVQYLAEEGRPVSERIWWVVVFIISFIINSYMISKIWHKWNTSPVIVSFSEKVTPIWEIPFPAVTICPLTRFNSSILNLNEALDEASENGHIPQELADISMLCLNVIGDNELSNFTTASENVTDLFNQIKYDPDELIHLVNWRGNRMGINDLAEVVTEDGVCYTFNIIHPQELFRHESVSEIFWSGERHLSRGWSLENGYSSDYTTLNSYPYRSSSSGMNEGFQMILGYVEPKGDYACHGPTPGFKISLHHPAQFPQISERYFQVPLEREVIVNVVPDIMRTSETLRSYSPRDRQCYFTSEKKLAYFNIYTQDNCEFECLMNLTLAKCGCIGFFMPKINNSIPICGYAKMDCVYDMKLEMNKILMNSYNNKDVTSEESCGSCLPSCTVIRYVTDVTQSDFEVKKFLMDIKPKSLAAIDPSDLEVLEKLKFSRILVYFSDKYFTSSKRSELYGVNDFLANCGGLLSLFSGLSLLSLVEIVYYLTLRCYNNFRRLKVEDNESANVEMDELRRKDA